MRGFQIKWVGHESGAEPGLYLVIYSIYHPASKRDRLLFGTGLYSDTYGTCRLDIGELCSKHILLCYAGIASETFLLCQ